MATIRLINPADKDKEQDINIILIKHLTPPVLAGVRPLLTNGMTIEKLTLSKLDTYTETTDKGEQINWVLPHKKNFPEFINKHFGENPMYISDKDMFLKDIAESTDDSPPFSYQILIRDYLRFGTPYRSLLLEHGLGSGKSRSAIMVAETFRAKGLKTLILTPAFLRLNFMDEIHKWADSDIKITNILDDAEVKKRQRVIDENYLFVHYNATGYSVGAKSKTGADIGGKGGVFEQLARIGIGFSKDDPKYGKMFPYLNDTYGGRFEGGLKPPSNMLIIIEEIHNLNRTFIGGNVKSGLKFYLYPLLLMATDCKIIGLSGTPIISSPFEMATLYNVLRGPIDIPGQLPGNTLPDSEDLFNESFVNYETLTLNNTNVLMSRIVGLSSLFKGVTEDVDRIIFPAGKDTPLKCELLMEPHQNKVHDEYLAAEDAKVSSKQRKTINLSGTDGGMRSKAQMELEPETSYHTSSRQAINFAFPSEIHRPRPYDDVPRLADTPLNTYLYEFNFRPDETYKKWKEIDSKVNLDDYDKSATEDDKRKKLSDIYKLTYDFPDEKKLKGMSVMNLLSIKDKRMIQECKGTYSARLNMAIEKLVEGAEKYFTLENLKNYSVKMAAIYKHITGDLQNGACHLVDDDPQGENVIAQEQEYEESLIEPEIEDEDENEKEEEDIVLKSQTKIIHDKDDPMNDHMDVFKSDSELKKINKRVRGGPALVYSFFNTVEGAGIFSKILEAHRFTQFKEDTWNGVENIELLRRTPRYAFIKGGMNTNLKAKIMRVFNHRANRHGQLIRVIFATQAAAEGISLYHLRQIHIMEPHWDNVLIEQVIGRGFRLRSHKYLSDKSEREIKIYQYYAMGRDDAKYKGKHTIDYRVQNIADMKSKLVGQLKSIRGATAIDCKINQHYNKLGVECFDFNGATTGDAFHASVKADISVDHTLHVVKSDISYTLINIATGNNTFKTLIRYNNQPPVKISIPTPKGNKEFAAQIVYHPPPGWTEGKTIDTKQFTKHGYMIINKSISQFVPLHSDIKEIA